MDFTPRSSSLSRIASYYHVRRNRRSITWSKSAHLTKLIHLTLFTKPHSTTMAAATNTFTMLLLTFLALVLVVSGAHKLSTSTSMTAQATTATTVTITDVPLTMFPLMLAPQTGPAGTSMVRNWTEYLLDQFTASPVYKS